MSANPFWLNDQSRAKIEPLIPMHSPGPKPQNNRRIFLSGIGLPDVIDLSLPPGRLAGTEASPDAVR
jgi:hypothetical protein